MIGRTIGHYRIVEKIGKGGMGTVWKAEDTTLHRTVAIKSLSPDLVEEQKARQRFIREAEAASSLNHPNITTIYELLEDGDQNHIAMEYVEGETIRQIVRARRVRSVEAVGIILQAAEALQTAHSHGLLHRDVKSANIMLTGEGRVKLTDFGLAHLDDRSSLTSSGTTLGTVAYSAPEHLTGQAYDARSDIWSLGVVLYELLARELPFSGASEGEVIHSIINNEPDRSFGMRADVPDSLEQILTRMLAKDPDRRYQDCGELIRDLTTIQATLDTKVIHIVEQPGILKRVIRRHWRIPAAAAATIGVFLIVSRLIQPGEPAVPWIAVMPFREIQALDDPSLAFSVASEIRDRLSGISGLRVVEFYGRDRYNTSGRNDEQIGRELGVHYLLKADIRQETATGAQARIRISPRLVKVSDSRVVPLEPMMAVLEAPGVLRLESDMAEQVTSALGVALLAEERTNLRAASTTTLSAREAYRTGRYHWNLRTLPDLEVAIEYFQIAINQDSTFAPAYSGLADVYALLPYYYSTLMSPEEAFIEGERLARRAVSLDPMLAEAHASLGYVVMYAHWDWEEAERELGTAVQLDPDYATGRYWYSEFLGAAGRFEEAILHAGRAAAIDPRSVVANNLLAYWLAAAGRYDEAEARFRNSLEINPAFTGTNWPLWNVFILSGHHREGLPFLVSSGYSEAIAERIHDAILDPTEREEFARGFWRDGPGPPYFNRATIYAHMELNDLALNMLEASYRLREPELLVLQAWRPFDGLHAEPRYQELLKNLGLD